MRLVFFNSIYYLFPLSFRVALSWPEFAPLLLRFTFSFQVHFLVFAALIWTMSRQNLGAFPQCSNILTLLIWFFIIGMLRIHWSDICLWTLFSALFKNLEMSCSEFAGVIPVAGGPVCTMNFIYIDHVECCWYYCTIYFGGSHCWLNFITISKPDFLGVAIVSPDIIYIYMYI